MASQVPTDGAVLFFATCASNPQNISKNNEDVELKTPTPSIFIADSSPIGNDEGKHAHPCAARRANPPSKAGVQSLRASCIGETTKGGGIRRKQVCWLKLWPAGVHMDSERTLVCDES